MGKPISQARAEVDKTVGLLEWYVENGRVMLAEQTTTIDLQVRVARRLEVGGVRKSNYGRELSHFGVHKFLSPKVIWHSSGT